MFAIDVTNVVKRYPRRRSLRELVRRDKRGYTEALSGLSFSVKPGELVGLLGPNGAGKTTLLKTLCGLVLPDAGDVTVLGLPANDSRLPERLGLANGDERSFYWRLTARENLDFFARLHGLTRRRRKGRVLDLIQQVELEDQADRRFADLSAGMKQRLAIARCLLADPEVVLMDEPTRSLDPVHVDHLTTWIRERLHADMGKSILLATHDLHVADKVCDRVLVMHHGRLQLDGPPSELRERGLADRVYRMRIRGSVPANLEVADLLQVDPVGDDEYDVRVRVPVDVPLHDVLQDLRDAGMLIDCSKETGDIEHGFMTVVSDQKESV